MLFRSGPETRSRGRISCTRSSIDSARARRSSRSRAATTPSIERARGVTRSARAHRSRPPCRRSSTASGGPPDAPTEPTRRRSAGTGPPPCLRRPPRPPGPRVRRARRDGGAGVPVPGLRPRRAHRDAAPRRGPTGRRRRAAPLAHAVLAHPPARSPRTAGVASPDDHGDARADVRACGVQATAVRRLRPSDGTGARALPVSLVRLHPALLRVVTR